MQPGDSLGKNLPGQSRPQLSLCVCIALRLPGCCGQEQTLVAQSPLSAHAPQATLLCTLFLHQAPGRQRACPDSGGVEADAEGASQHSRNWKTNTVSAADVLGLVRPPHCQLGVKGIPCLTKVERPFQSTQGLAGHQGRRAAPAAGLGHRRRARAPHRGCWALVSVQPLRAGCPEGHGETGLQNTGALAASPQQPHGSAPERGESFWGK